MTSLLISVFVASLLGSLHCAGMCGGLVSFFSGLPGVALRTRLSLHALYQGGRLSGYLTLGSLAGALGSGADSISARAGLGSVAAAAAGTIMLVSGLVLLLRSAGVRLHTVAVPAFVQRLAASTLSRLSGRPPAVRAALLGLCSGLLPCGWLWAFVVVAAGTGGLLKGAVVMGAFWLGAVPALLMVGESVRALAGRVGARMPAVMAAALMCVGVLTVLRRSSFVPVSGDQPAATSVPTEAPCHGH